MDKDILLALTNSGSLVLGVLIKSGFDYLKARRQISSGETQVVKKQIPPKLGFKEKRSVFRIREHFLFLRSDSYPRRPICPDCFNKNRKSYLDGPLEDDGVIIRLASRADGYYCYACSYRIDAPCSMRRLQMEAQKFIESEKKN